MTASDLPGDPPEDNSKEKPNDESRVESPSSSSKLATPTAAQPRFHLKVWTEARWSTQPQYSLQSAFEQRPLALGSLDQPRPEDFGLLAYAYLSSVSTATALRSLTSHPFFRELGVQVDPEPVAAAAPPRPNGQVAERVRVRVPLPTARFELPPRALVEEALASIVGLGRWRVDVRRDERFFTRELVLPSTRGDTLTPEQGLKLAQSLSDGEYTAGNQASLLCGWEPLDNPNPEPSGLQRSHLSGQRLSGILGAHSRALYESARGSSRLADRLLVVMAEACGLIYKAAVAARTLRTSERTMRRRLAAEGTNFQQVLDDFRAALAKDYLAITTLPTQLIGELLGFTEATNFRRAFIRWAGESPHQYRRSDQG